MLYQDKSGNPAPKPIGNGIQSVFCGLCALFL
jgi:hypothetical protein